jgi:hypothetical protein
MDFLSIRITEQSVIAVAENKRRVCPAGFPPRIDLLRCHPSLDCSASDSARKDQGQVDLPWSNTPPARKGRAIGEPMAPAVSCLQAASESRHLAGFRRRLSRGAQVLLRWCRGFSHFGCDLNRKWQFQLRLFRLPMVAMVQRPDARSFFFRPQLSVSNFLALVLKV